MEIKLSKQARKYLASVDEPTRRKLNRAIARLSQMKGDIMPLRGQKDMFRYKISHYRILFRWVKGEVIISVIEINTRTNIKY